MMWWVPDMSLYFYVSFTDMFVWDWRQVVFPGLVALWRSNFVHVAQGPDMCQPRAASLEDHFRDASCLRQASHCLQEAAKIGTWKSWEGLDGVAEAAVLVCRSLLQQLTPAEARPQQTLCRCESLRVVAHHVTIAHAH